MAVSKQFLFDIVQGELENEQSDIEHLRTLSDRELGAMIAAACRSAAKIEEGRARSGLPPVMPDEWPDSTWKLLRKLSNNAS